MILIADSGSTNTDWILIKGDKIISKFITNGFNPYFVKSEDIYIELEEKFPAIIDLCEINTILFYGSGCSAEEMKEIVRVGLNQFFTNANIEINHDLFGAARALFYKESGIAVILGTGASSCFYNGLIITERIPSLGYVLGDEGGGDYLGKLFITDFLYGRLPENINKAFVKNYELTDSRIKQILYTEPYPNRFLASFCPFISEHSKDPFINEMILRSFSDLVVNNVKRYKNYKNYKVRVAGSIGYYFEKQLKEVAERYNINIDLIEKSPIERLAQFHIINK